MENFSQDWYSKAKKGLPQHQGRFINEIRIQHHKTQVQIADSAGINHSTVCHIGK